jgi:hypothetical protein
MIIKFSSPPLCTGNSGFYEAFHGTFGVHRRGERNSSVELG